MVLVELFPFGRTKFAGELLPLLEAARAAGARVVCSLRDILVARAATRRAYDERACLGRTRSSTRSSCTPTRAFARLEESFHPRDAAAGPGPLHGLRRARRRRGTAPRRPRARRPAARGGVGRRRRHGGAAAARGRRGHRSRWPTPGVDDRSSPGRSCPRPVASCCAAARGRPARGPPLRPDLCAELAHGGRSVSQCGYNTALDLLRAGVPALVVPFAEGGEDEQTRRAERLGALGAVRVLAAAAADGAALADAIREPAARAGPRPSSSTSTARADAQLIVGNCSPAPPADRAALRGSPA